MIFCCDFTSFDCAVTILIMFYSFSFIYLFIYLLTFFLFVLHFLNFTGALQDVLDLLHSEICNKFCGTNKEKIRTNQNYINVFGDLS